MPKPTNAFVSPELTDMYQITMAYAYWKSGRADDWAVFEMFFRKNPFGGAFTVFAGLEEVLRMVENFKFTAEQIEYIKTLLPHAEPEFFEYLATLDCSKVKIYAPREGSLVFPKEPLYRVEGPLVVGQLLETTLLNLTNFPTLIATNAAHFRLAAGPKKTLLEFGLRRAQGPDGAISAARYGYIGGFDATSNVLAGHLFGIPVKGTHAHAFVQSFQGLYDIKDPMIKTADGRECNFIRLVKKMRSRFQFGNTNEGELAAFMAYAMAFPKGFLALVDTYDTLKSGIPNFIIVAAALQEIGYDPVGIRLDSGDLAFLGKEARRMFRKATETGIVNLSGCLITASNDINLTVLESLNAQGHEIDAFGIGTHFVTCQMQPALGGVYKLVEINGRPCIKLALQEPAKSTIPGRKKIYRLVGSQGMPIIDLMTCEDEPFPANGEHILCCDPHDQTKRVWAKPAQVVCVQQLVWADGKRQYPEVSLEGTRKFVLEQLEQMRPDYLRRENPTPYKVSVTEKLFAKTRDLWAQNAPIAEIS